MHHVSQTKRILKLQQFFESNWQQNPSDGMIQTLYGFIGPLRRFVAKDSKADSPFENRKTTRRWRVGRFDWP